MPNRPSTWKNCVTCNYWTGPRKPTTFRDRVEFNSEQDNGECAGGGWDRSQRSAVSTCNKWVKWGVLK